VRGLDYYSNVIFEFVTNSLGSQGTIIAGGSYDGLISKFGGPSTSGIGWAAGLDRLELMWKGSVKKLIPIIFMPVDNSVVNICLLLLQCLRYFGIHSEIYYSGSLSKRLKKASKANIKCIVIMGESEVKSGYIKVRLLDSGLEKEISLSNFFYFFMENKSYVSFKVSSSIR
jgi:histidyl-tRNA synthetase